MKIKYAFLLVFLPILAPAQVFYTESFEGLSGWTLDYTFDDGADSYCKRDNTIALDFLGYTLSGQDGDFVIAAENTDGTLGQSPDDAIITMNLDPVSIVGMSNLELVVRLSCNAASMAYDDRSQPNGDYVDFQINIDGSGWNTFAQFNSKAGGSSISTLYHDADMDGDGGELGELAVTEVLKNFVLPISSTGNSAQLRVQYRMDGGDEVIVMDEFRLRQSQGDDLSPGVYSAQVIDQSTLQIIFQEPVNSGAEQLFHYAGVSGLTSAVLQLDQQTVILNYSSPFQMGTAYQLVVFSVQDLAGNAMSSAFNFPFYFNPTTPNLVITEIMYNDPSVADTLEFIEIYNLGASPAIVGGFRIEGAVTHTLASITIPVGGFYLVARQSLSAQSFYETPFYDYGGQLSDNSEDIILVNVDGVLLDQVTYNDNVPWPTAADGSGPSMELVSPSLDNQIGNNWVASSNGLGFINGLPLFATPGQLPGTMLPSIEFDNNDIWVNEFDGVIQLDLYIAAANNSSSSVHIEMISGTATSPADHGITTISELTLSANSNGIETVAFPLVNDNILEGIEYFTIRMTSVNNCTIGFNDEIRIIIVDDEYVAPSLFINEVQSANTLTVQDPAGEWDDWFEIYNPNIFPIDLAGYYISDDPTQPLKDRIVVADANTIIPALGFKLFWADQQLDQGPLHVNFKLNATGESVLLSSPDASAIVDQLDFGAIPQDQSYGRECDGASLLSTFTVPTPGSSNCPNGLDESIEILNDVYPNPVSGILNLPQKLNYVLYDIEGRELMRGVDNQIDMSNLSEGVYLLVSGSSYVKLIMQ